MLKKCLLPLRPLGFSLVNLLILVFLQIVLPFTTKSSSVLTQRKKKKATTMDVYQGGTAYQVYNPQGSKPLESLKVTGGSVRKEYDKGSKSQVIIVEQPTSKITVPKQLTGALLVHPIVVVQIFAINITSIAIEFTVVDSLGKRRLIFSNSFATIQPNPQHTKFPFQLMPKQIWLDLIFDVRSLHRNVYETRAPVGFRGVESLTVSGAGCKVRRIYSLKELPPMNGGLGFQMFVPSQFALPADVEQQQIVLTRGDELMVVGTGGKPSQPEEHATPAPMRKVDSKAAIPGKTPMGGGSSAGPSPKPTLAAARQALGSASKAHLLSRHVDVSLSSSPPPLFHSHDDAMGATAGSTDDVRARLIPSISPLTPSEAEDNINEPSQQLLLRTFNPSDSSKRTSARIASVTANNAAVVLQRTVEVAPELSVAANQLERNSVSARSDIGDDFAAVSRCADHVVEFRQHPVLSSLHVSRVAAVSSSQAAPPQGDLQRESITRASLSSRPAQAADDDEEEFVVRHATVCTDESPDKAVVMRTSARQVEGINPQHSAVQQPGAAKFRDVPRPMTLSSRASCTTDIFDAQREANTARQLRLSDSSVLVVDPRGEMEESMKHAQSANAFGHGDSQSLGHTSPEHHIDGTQSVPMLSLTNVHQHAVLFRSVHLPTPSTGNRYRQEEQSDDEDEWIPPEEESTTGSAAGGRCVDERAFYFPPSSAESGIRVPQVAVVGENSAGHVQPTRIPLSTLQPPPEAITIPMPQVYAQGFGHGPSVQHQPLQQQSQPPVAVQAVGAQQQGYGALAHHQVGRWGSEGQLQQPLSPPPPVRDSTMVLDGLGGSPDPHSVADGQRYEFDPIVGCYFDKVTNRFVKPPQQDPNSQALLALQQQQHGGGAVPRRGAIPGVIEPRSAGSGSR